MSSKPTIEQLFHRALTFPGPSSRLAGLEIALKTVEEQLVHTRAQQEVRLKAKLKRHGKSMHPEDIEMEEYDLAKTVDEILPKVFRGGFVISMWSVFEACVKDMAEYTRRQRKIPFGLQDLRAGDFLGQTEKFFEGALGLKAFPDKSMRRKIEELRGLRNALAHHDGSTNELPKSLRGRDATHYEVLGLQVYRDLHHEYAIPNAEYARQALAAVHAYLECLATRVYANLHPENVQDGDA
jgi:hypothetical protein